MPFNSPEKRKAYRIRNRAKHAVYERARRQRLGDILRVRQRNRYATDPEYREHRRTLAKEYRRKTHPPKLQPSIEERRQARLAMRRRVGKRWYEANKQHKNDKSHEWYVAHKELVTTRSKRWHATHPDKMKALSRFYTQKRKADLAKLPHTLTLEQWEAIKRIYRYRCAYCQKRVKTLHQDHVVPLKQGGSYTADNIVPACKSCNSSKRDKVPPITPLRRLLI